MIRSTDCDTELPRNLHDEDFDEDTKTLPPSRPSSELTGMSYMIAKSSIAFVFGKIVERTHTVEAPAYEEIMTLDREIMEAYHGLPPLFHMKPMEESNHDPISTLEMRFHISMLYNKSLCVLHRKYLVRARENSRYAHSRRACIDASMTLLHHQETLYRESQPGKRMHKGQWYGYSHQSHDFILAATLVCLDLLHSAQDEATGRSTGDLEMWGTDRREEMLAAVEYSNNIWNELRDRYIEAFKAQTMINVMLQKIQAVRAQTAARMAQGAFSYAAANGGGSGGGSSKGDAAAGAVPASTAQQQQFGPSDDIKPEHSAAITLGMLSSGGQPNGVPGAYSNGPYPPTPGSTNATMTDLATGSGLTPNFAVDGPPGGAAVNAVNAPSPFSFFNGANMEMTSNIDWVSVRSASCPAAASRAMEWRRLTLLFFLIGFVGPFHTELQHGPDHRHVGPDHGRASPERGRFRARREPGRAAAAAATATAQQQLIREQSGVVPARDDAVKEIAAM